MKTLKKLVKRLEKSLVILSVGTALLSLSACQTTIKNQEWCGDFSPGGADCFQTLRPEKRTLNQAQWDKLRFGQVCTQASNYADIKAALEKLCSAGRCRFEKELQFPEILEAEKLGTYSHQEQEALRHLWRFIGNLEAIDKKAKRLRMRR